MPGVVCSAMAVQTVSISCCGYAMAAEEVTGSIGAVDLETLMRARMLRGEAHVVKHRAGVKQLGIEAEAAALAGKCAPVIDAARVVEQQR